MPNWRTHPADATLILAVDRELAFERHRQLDRHLQGCDACRSRLAAFADAAQDATRACRDRAGDDSVVTSALRQRLQERMTELGADWDRSLLFRFRRAAHAVPLVARVGVTLACLALAVGVVQSRVNGTAVPRASQSDSLPNTQFTPGAASHVSVAALCTGARPPRRVISIAVRQQVLQQYRMEHVAPSEYELDYLITPELGGEADARNLWPERYTAGLWNARVKDDLERLLPRLVCSGAVDLGVAQREIAGNWIDAYKKYFKTERPVPRQAGLADDDDDEVLFDAAPGTLGTAVAVLSWLDDADVSMSAVASRCRMAALPTLRLDAHAYIHLH